MNFYQLFPNITVIGIGTIAERPTTAETTQHAYWAWDEETLYIAGNDLAWKPVGSGSDTFQVKITSSDTTTGFIDDKFSFVDGLSRTVLDSGGDEVFQIGIDDNSITDDKLVENYSLVGHTHTVSSISGLGALALLNSVGAGEIDTDAVGADELADNSVDTAAIQDDAVDGSKIADNSIVLAHMTDDSVGNDELIDESVDISKLASDVLALIASSGAADATKVYDASFTQATSSPLSLFTPSANEEIFKVVLRIPTAASGGGSGAVLKVGTVADDDMYVESDQVNLYSAGNYIIECWVNAGATPDPILLTITPDSNTFSGIIEVFHVAPA